MLFDIEVLALEILSYKDRTEALKLPNIEQLEEQNNSIKCDCENYNTNI